MSLGTFAIVLTDRIQIISLPVAFIGGCFGLLILSILFDKTGIRQMVNASESVSNPKMIELMTDVKDIKRQLEALKKP